jgi:FKBP-type peptidyl-prolyl cis-trans isomerase FkpA
MLVGRNLQAFNMTQQELELVKKGLNDMVFPHALSDGGTGQDVQLDQYGPKVQGLARSRQMAKAETEKKAGAAYAEKAATEPGAQKLPSGVVYKALKEGDGASPKPEDRVKVHYTGTLENGTKFDSSVDRGTPATFQLNQVVKCWTEGVAKMKVGGKARLVCPSDTAYGDQGRPGIPGGATLIFEVELISIEPPLATPPPGVSLPIKPPPGMKLPGAKGSK